MESCLSAEEEDEDADDEDVAVSAADTDREGAAKDGTDGAAGTLPLPRGPRDSPLMDEDRLWLAAALCTLLNRR